MTRNAREQFQGQTGNTDKVLLGVGLRRIGMALMAFFVQTLLMALVPLMVYLDLAVFELGMKDGNITESLQSLLLLTSAALYCLTAVRIREARPFLVLIAGFLLCMLIREQDEFFDAVGESAWAYPVAFVMIALSVYARKAGLKQVVQSAAAFIGSRAYYYLVFGLLLVLAFSRLFGSGETVWQFIPGLENPKHFKNTVQEGIELAGYIFLCLGAVMLLRDGRKSFSRDYLPIA